MSQLSSLLSTITSNLSLLSAYIKHNDISNLDDDSLDSLTKLKISMDSVMSVFTRYNQSLKLLDKIDRSSTVKGATILNNAYNTAKSLINFLYGIDPLLVPPIISKVPLGYAITLRWSIEDKHLIVNIHEDQKIISSYVDNGTVNTFTNSASSYNDVYRRLLSMGLMKKNE